MSFLRCFDCKHHDLPGSEEPCVECVGHDDKPHWQAAVAHTAEDAFAVPPAPIGHNGGPPISSWGIGGTIPSYTLPDSITLPAPVIPGHPDYRETITPPIPRREVTMGLSLPDDDAVRSDFPMADGLLDYFPNALAEVSRVSKIGNDQHNPGEPMHWARDKSTDHANKIMRHMVDRGRMDGRGVRHTARLAWRALAMLQTEIEQAEGFPQSRASIGQAPVQA